MIKELLDSKDYFKFMVARHPFERITSGYLNKLATDTDPPFRRILMREIHRQRIGSGGEKDHVTFQEFVRFLHVNTNRHFEPIVNLCQPCYIRYDRVVKTETMDGDNADIINSYFGPFKRGLGTSSNVVGQKTSSSESTLTQHGRKFDIYRNVSRAEMEFMVNKFRHDLEYFGYSYRREEESGVVYTACVDGGGKGTQCC